MNKKKIIENIAKFHDWLVSTGNKTIERVVRSDVEYLKKQHKKEYQEEPDTHEIKEMKKKVLGRKGMFSFFILVLIYTTLKAL